MQAVTPRSPAAVSGGWALPGGMEAGVIVKICGIRTLEEARTALAAGADMLGFNFYPPSPRFITPADCARLLRGLPGRERWRTVGVFVNETPDWINAVMEACGLDLAQLSGDEPPAYLEHLNGRAFKALRPRSREEARRLAERYSPSGGPGPALLLDACRPGEFGGTGHTVDWDLAAELAQDYPLLLAGGLHPGNVARALAQVRPWGVDVASGVEAAPGEKDPQKLSAFVEAVRKSERESAR